MRKTALEIFRLVGSIFVDNDKANESISKTDKKAEGVGKTLLKGIGTAAKWTAGLVAGAGAVVAGVTKLATNTSKAADEIDKMSQKLGLSRTAYQEWDYVLSQSGMDINSMSTGLKTLTNKIDDAKNGSSSASEMFGKLGISMEQLKSMSREEIFDATIKSMQGMGDTTERAALANDLFGKSGQNLAPLLNSTAESTEALKNKAHELGMIMSDETIDAGVKMTDTIDTLKRAGQGIVNHLGGSFLPILQTVADSVIFYLPQIQSMVGQLAPTVNLFMTQLLPPLLTLGGTLLPMIFSILGEIMPIAGTILQSILPVIIQLLQMLLPPTVQIVQKLLPPLLNLLIPILSLLSPIISLLEPILSLVVSLLDPIARLITGLLTPLINVIVKLIGSALTPLQSAFQVLSGILSGVVSSTINNIVDRFNNVKNILNNLLSFIKNVFTGNWRAAWQNVKNIFSSIASSLGSIFKSPINTIINGINVFIRGLNKIKIPDWVPGVGGKGFHISEIPRLIRGGVLERGQVGFLEGTGAEAVVPLENNRKWISAVARDMNGALSGNNGRIIELLSAILAILKNIDEELVKKFVQALSQMRFDINDREFARLVKEYA